MAARRRRGWGQPPDILDPFTIASQVAPPTGPKRATKKKKATKAKGTSKPRAAAPRQKSVTRSASGKCTVSFTTKDGRRVKFPAKCPPKPQGKWHCTSFKTVTNANGNRVRRCSKYVCN